MRPTRKHGQTKEKEGDAQEDKVRVAREGREDPQGLEGTQRSIQAQAGRGREVDGQEAHRQRLEPRERRRGPSQAPALEATSFPAGSTQLQYHPSISTSGRGASTLRSARRLDGRPRQA